MTYGTTARNDDDSLTIKASASASTIGDFDAAQARPSPLGAVIGLKTDVLSGSDMLRSGAGQIAVSVTQAQPELPMVPVAKEMSAVISRVEAHEVEIACDMAGDRVVISVPPSLVPFGCRQYGDPVWVGLQDRAGVKKFSITPRESSVDTNDDEVDELIDWINS